MAREPTGAPGLSPTAYPAARGRDGLAVCAEQRPGREEPGSGRLAVCGIADLTEGARRPSVEPRPPSRGSYVWVRCATSIMHIIQ